MEPAQCQLIARAPSANGVQVKLIVAVYCTKLLVGCGHVGATLKSSSDNLMELLTAIDSMKYKMQYLVFILALEDPVQFVVVDIGKLSELLIRCTSFPYPKAGK